MKTLTPHRRKPFTVQPKISGAYFFPRLLMARVARAGLRATAAATGIPHNTLAGYNIAPFNMPLQTTEKLAAHFGARLVLLIDDQAKWSSADDKVLSRADKRIMKP